MAVTLSTTPKTVDFARNKVGYKLTGTNYLDETGAYGFFEISGWPSEMTANNAFTLSFEGMSLTFTAKASPDDSGLQIRVPSTKEILAEDLAANYYINKYFRVVAYSAPADMVILTKRNHGEDPSLEYDAGDSTMNFNSNQGSDRIIEDNYKILAKIEYEEIWGSGSYVNLPDIWMDINADGEAKLLIGNLLRPFLEPKDVPTFNTTSGAKLTKALIKYRARFAEYYGDPATAKKLASDSYRYLMDARLDFMAYPSQNFFNGLSGQLNRFLNNYLYPQTSYPAIKTYTTAQHYLYVMRLGGSVTTINLDLVVYYTDGTSSTYNAHKAVTTVGLYDVVRFPAGYTQLGIAVLNPSKTVSGYSLKAGTTDPWSTDTVLFELVDKPWNGRDFLYINSFGLLESLLCFGAGSGNISGGAREVEKTLEHDYTTSDRQYENIQLNAREQHTVTTGLMLKERATMLRDLLISNKMWVADTVNNRWIPVNINPGSLALYDDDEDMSSLRFSYSNAFNL